MTFTKIKHSLVKLEYSFRSKEDRQFHKTKT